MNFQIALFISTIAGLSTLIGAIFILFIKNKKQNYIIFSLSFASIIMFLICVFDLIPSGYSFITNNFNKTFSILTMLFFIIIGINISSLIETLVDKKSDHHNKIFKVGIISMIAIIMHNIPEGMATFIATNNNIKLGILLSISIALHNIPEGISIALPIYYGTNNKNKALLYTLIAGLSEPLGALIAFFILTPYINEITLGVLYFIISGIMLQISLLEILPTSLSYKNYRLVLTSVIIGIIIFFITKSII